MFNDLKKALGPSINYVVSKSAKFDNLPHPAPCCLLLSKIYLVNRLRDDIVFEWPLTGCNIMFGFMPERHIRHLEQD